MNEASSDSVRLTSAQERALRTCLRAGTGSWSEDTWFRRKHFRTVEVLLRHGYVTRTIYGDVGRMWITQKGRRALGVKP